MRPSSSSRDEILKCGAVSALHVVRLLFGGRRKAIIHATTSAGSLGDQAMMDVIGDEARRRGLDVVFVYRPNWRATLLRGPYQDLMLQASPVRHLQCLMALSAAGQFAMIGADMLDGAYNKYNVLSTLKLVDIAQTLGVPASVMNFSYGATPDCEISAYLRRMRGVTFTPRDGVSRARFKAHTGIDAEVAADVAFLLRPEITAQSARLAKAWLQQRKAMGDVVLAVNASGHTLARMGASGSASYVSVLRTWLSKDTARSVFLMPHDLRPAPTGDVEATGAIYEGLRMTHDDRVYALSPPFDAWDVKALMREVDGVFTGRMHAAIAGLGMGAPPLSVVYAGKFEGLLDHFGLSHDLLIEPEDFAAEQEIASRLERFCADLPALRAQVASRLGAVQRTCSAHFDWLSGERSPEGAIEDHARRSDRN